MYHGYRASKDRRAVQPGPVVVGFTNSIEANNAWRKGLYHLLPDIRLPSTTAMQRRMVAVVEWRETNSSADRVRTEAAGVRVAHIPFGRMTHILIWPDTTILTKTLARPQAAGNTGAMAKLITG